MSFGEGNLRERCAELERALIAEQVENERLRKRIEELERRLEVQENETACQSADLVAPKGFILPKEEIVRCRDCKHYGEKTYCFRLGEYREFYVEPDGFCAWGEAE